jgi:hypothetical protein
MLCWLLQWAPPPSNCLPLRTSPVPASSDCCPAPPTPPKASPMYRATRRPPHQRQQPPLRLLTIVPRRLTPTTVEKPTGEFPTPFLHPNGLHTSLASESTRPPTTPRRWPPRAMGECSPVSPICKWATSP